MGGRPRRLQAPRNAQGPPQAHGAFGHDLPSAPWIKINNNNMNNRDNVMTNNNNLNNNNINNNNHNINNIDNRKIKMIFV